MRLTNLFAAIALLLISANAFAQNTPLWMRYPAISPDGKTIAFGYKGDIYTVPASGGIAMPLTIYEAQDMMPVWSHDGRSIAFASDRYGNFDVFIMPATGGAPLRLTYNSAPDYPSDFTPDDKNVIFGSSRDAPSESIRFSSLRLFKNEYKVPVTGGRSILLSAAGMENAHFNSKGTQLVFQDTKGYEDEWRKHHTSSVTKDIWLMDAKANTYTQLSNYAGEDREPLFSHDDASVYYLSEKNGSQNIYKMPLGNKGGEQQLTTMTKNPIRHLSASNDNTLCFTYDGEIYTMKEGSQPQRIVIQIINDGRAGVEKNVPVNGNTTEFALNPNGKEIAFVTRGEIFVTAVDGGQTKRITNTPQQERMVQWSPDGKTLVYAAERNDNWDIYKTTIVRADEPYFFTATVLKEEPVIATSAEEYQPRYSPDGKEIGYIENRNVLKIYNIATKKTRTLLPEGHNYSYADGDWDFHWSPDSKYVLADDSKGYFGNSNTALIDAVTDTSIYPVNSGFGEYNSKWYGGGKVMTYLSNKAGRKSLANQGSSEFDVYALFFDRDLYDQFKLSDDDYKLWKEQQDKAKKDSTATGKKSTAQKKKDTLIKLDFENLDQRIVRLTINSSSISDYELNSDASKLYYLAAFEKGYDLWVTDTRTKETKILAKLGGTPSGIEISDDGKSLYVSNSGRIAQVNADNGKVTPISIDGEMTLNAAAERQYIFDHTWRQVKEKFYDPKMQGVDWAYYKTEYAKFLPHISNNYDFQELLSEMLGELNASHTGGRYRPQNPTGDITPSLGLLYDETYTGNGLKISEVIAGGPADKATSKIATGCIIQKINGEPITDTVDWAKYLNRLVGDNTLLTVYNPSAKTTFEEVVKPITTGEESGLMYNRWIKREAAMVDKLSGGKIGYVHVEAMDDESLREVYDKAMGENLNKQALIVDTRFNGGGWLHDDLNTFLTGKTYLQFAPQSHVLKGGEPMGRWQKPSCVITSESNYSDAFIFPYIYKQNGDGKLIGMPVPGTGTAVWWETQIDPTIVFGIPMVATIGKEGRPTENLQVNPDIRVPLPYENFLKGKDDQLEAAVKEMLQETSGAQQAKQ